MTATARTLSIEETLLDPPALPPPPTRHALLVILIALAALLHVVTVGTGDLYEYDLEKPEGEALTDLTPTENPGEARVQGVLGASDDGNYLYFVASGALAPGASAQNCEATNSATGCNRIGKVRARVTGQNRSRCERHGYLPTAVTCCSCPKRA